MARKPLKWWGPKLRRWAEEMAKRTSKENDKDVVVIITGEEGNGKSSLACHFLQWFDPSFGVDRITVDGAEFVRLGKTLSSGKARLWDEAKGGGFNREGMTTANKQVAEHLFESRVLRQYSFVLWPNIRWLEPVISEHRATYWMLVTKKGEALLHEFVRADYKGAKPRWKQLFSFDFPKFDAEWWPTYLKQKEDRVRAFKATTEEGGATVLPEVPAPTTQRVWKRVLREANA